MVEAVEHGLFHIYTAEHVSEGIELLTGLPAGIADEMGNYPRGSVLGHVQKTLLAYRRACHLSNPNSSLRLTSANSKDDIS